MSQIKISSKSRSKYYVLRVLDAILRVVGAFMIVVMFVSLVGSWRFSEVSPPRDLRSIGGFRKWRPDLTEAEQFSIRGINYFVVHGPIARFLASGRSEFYFDSNGSFLTWNPDVGDMADPRIFHPGNTTRTLVKILDIPDQK